MLTPRELAARGRAAVRDLRAVVREHRERQTPITSSPAAARGDDGAAPPTREEQLFPPGRHDRAWMMWARTLRAHPHLPDRESRLCELVEYYGWDVASKAPYCTPWFYEDDPRKRRYIEECLGLDEVTFSILHMYSLFNRMDPDRHDLYFLYDGLLDHLESLGGAERLSVLDFGTGLGQNGLAFALAGYRTVMTDVVGPYLDFIRFLAELRGVEPILHRAEDEHSYFDTAADGHPFGLVIEWSSFEHVHDVVPALEKITAGLVPGGIFLTTTFCKDWTPELLEHYRRDSGSDDIADQYMSPETDAWIRERFDVLSPERTIAKVLVKR